MMATGERLTGSGCKWIAMNLVLIIIHLYHHYQKMTKHPPKQLCPEDENHKMARDG